MKPNPSADRAWFYQDPARVKRYAGQYVAVSGMQVVGSGRSVEAYRQARERGVVRPLLIRVNPPREGGPVEHGL